MPKARKENKKHRHREYNKEEPPSQATSTNTPVSDTTPAQSFDDLNLKPSLLRGIYAHGFERPSAIQQRAIRPILRGRDVIAQSQSGTGKTAVFSIASLQMLEEKSSEHNKYLKELVEIDENEEIECEKVASNIASVKE